MRITGILLLLSVQATAQLRISADSHYLYEKSTGLPVFLNGESVWALFTATTYVEADSFFMNCQQYGINFLETMLPEDGFTGASSPANRNGDDPFTSTYFTTPNEAYFTHADSIIGMAKARGIYLHIYISYLGSNDGEGVRTRVAAASTADMQSWGNYIGTRYKDSTNIMWGISGDTDPTTWQTKVDSMAIALLAVDTNHIITPRDEPNTRTATHWSSRSWLKLQYIYPYWGPQEYVPYRIVTLANASWNASEPAFLEEAWYDNEKSVGDFPETYHLRQQMYYPVLSGAVCGQVFGSFAWSFDLGSRTWLGPGGWRDSLDSHGHQSTGHAGKLFRSRYWYKLIPDIAHAVVTAGYGAADSSFVPVSRTSDSSSIIAYCPSARTLTIDPSWLTGDSCRVYWFNPGTGVATFESNQDNAGTFQVTSPSPSSIERDRVLVVDSKSFDALFDVPGGAAPGATPTYLNWRK